MIRLSGVTVPLDFDFTHALPSLAAKTMRLSADRIKSARLSKKSVDARKKHDVHFTLSIDVELLPNTHFSPGALPRGVTSAMIDATRYTTPHLTRYHGKRPLVVGFGPAGLFAALTLARAGLHPLVIERGQDVDTRARDVRAFFKTGALNPSSNIQFGEGGAGAFSDGKLNTGISDPRCRAILEALVEAGAPESILYDAKPHVGTDKLPGAVRAIRETIRLLGGEVLFGHRLLSLVQESCRVTGARIERPTGEVFSCETDDILLAIGHSARDTFEALHAQGIPMLPKSFSIGVRIEHAQSSIDRAQYGAFSDHPALSAADYKLNIRLPNGRSVYTFCMCPGGQVVAAASEERGVVTNGMSRYARDGENANSALLVGIGPEDYESDHPLAGLFFQRKWERLAFELGGGNYRAPAQRVGDFLQNTPSTGAGDVPPTYAPGVAYGAIDGCLPPFAAASLRAALPLLDQKLRSFAAPGALLTGVETRSSSPVRIPRDGETLTARTGLYPCGEGAGYAGGIMSAAVDGMRCAEAVIARYTPRQ